MKFMRDLVKEKEQYPSFDMRNDNIHSLKQR